MKSGDLLLPKEGRRAEAAVTRACAHAWASMVSETEMSIEGGRWFGCCYLAAAVLEAEELHRLLRAVDGDDWMKHYTSCSESTLI